MKLSISVPDDVAAYLQSRGNASAAVTEAVRRVPPDARRDRRRAAAQATRVPPRKPSVSSTVPAPRNSSRPTAT
ncbi:hypothetical protein [Actinoplanes regularis]|uniref:hypothetical protein n=1 Tax=Actinoplanes regularis TaxID=52697 RepID=UPI000B790813|nr:hypothetical protein [Actinoplanes regularis]GIE87714.1 hypothetical protein Are01nite_41940 [Actinoplanes regularis]